MRECAMEFRACDRNKDRQLDFNEFRYLLQVHEHFPAP